MIGRVKSTERIDEVTKQIARQQVEKVQEAAQGVDGQTEGVPAVASRQVVVSVDVVLDVLKTRNEVGAIGTVEVEAEPINDIEVVANQSQ